MKAILTSLRACIKISKEEDSDVENKTSLSFEDVAKVYIKHLDFSKMDHTTKLQIYAYYKQATIGNNNTMKPSSYSSKFKWEAWNKLRDIDKEEAKKQYVKIYNQCRKKELNDEVKRYLSESVKPLKLEKVEINGYISPYVDDYFTSVSPDQLPKEMVKEYLSTTFRKYATTGKGKLMNDILSELPPKRIKDWEFKEAMKNGISAKFLHPFTELRDEDSNHYRKLFKLDKNIDGFIADTTYIRALQVKEADNVWIAPAVVLFDKDINPLAIAAENINDIDCFPPIDFPKTLENLTLVYPSDGLAWEMAKLHVLHNLMYSITAGIHTVEHLTILDPIAITVMNLAPQNMMPLKTPSIHLSILHQMLSKHSYLELLVNSGLLHSNISVLWCEESFCYPWNVKVECRDNPINGNSVFNISKVILSGWNNHPIYGKLNILYDDCRHEVGRYLKLLSCLRQIVSSFCDSIFSVIDEDVNEIMFIEKFLKDLIIVLPRKSFLRDLLSNTTTTISSMKIMRDILSYVIFTCIEHSLDHKQANQEIMREYTHLIIKKPIPFGDKSHDDLHISTEISNINSISDRSKYRMAHSMFINDHPSKTLHDFFVKEGGYFKDIQHDRIVALKALEDMFIRDLAELLRSDLSTTDITQVAMSVQF